MYEAAGTMGEFSVMTFQSPAVDWFGIQMLSLVVVPFGRGLAPTMKFDEALVLYVQVRTPGLPLPMVAAWNGRLRRQFPAPGVLVEPIVSMITTWQVRPIFMYCPTTVPLPSDGALVDAVHVGVYAVQAPRMEFHWSRISWFSRAAETVSPTTQVFGPNVTAAPRGQARRESPGQARVRVRAAVRGCVGHRGGTRTGGPGPAPRPRRRGCRRAR